MSTKALKTQLLAAIAMVLVASIALGSSTYAWFANNNKVDATGMSITAQNNTAALLISADKTTADGIQEDGKTSATAKTLNANIFPAAHNTFTSTTDVSTVGNWYTGSSADPNSSTLATATKTTLTSFDKYVLINTFYVTVAKGSAEMQNLIVDSVTITGDPAGRVVVATDEGYQEFSATVASGANTTGTKLAASITENSVITVKVYFYLDGNADNVYTNNFANLKETTVSLAFSASPATV